MKNYVRNLSTQISSIYSTKLHFMKNLSVSVMAFICLCGLMAFTTVTKSFTPEKSVALVIPKGTVVLPESPIETVKVEINLKGHDQFLNAIGHRESTNNYKAVNQFGYLGRYQFGRRTLDALGFDDITNREFLSSPAIQEDAMSELLLHNKKILKKLIDKYEGKVIHGVLITESGVLAAAHLAGPGNVKKFFRKGYEFKDGNGTKMTSYMKRFSGFNLDLRY